MPPAKQVAVVACMDARLNPYGVWGLQEGDPGVIRNAGGLITHDELRSLAISQRLLGIPLDHPLPAAAALRSAIGTAAYYPEDPT